MREGIFLAVEGMVVPNWAIDLGYTDGFTRLVPSAITVLLISGSFFFLSRSLIELPVGTTYVVWTEIERIGTVYGRIISRGKTHQFVREI
jgi:quaternary ammonium compound-resistance protein SugE